MECPPTPLALRPHSGPCPSLTPGVGCLHFSLPFPFPSSSSRPVTPHAAPAQTPLPSGGRLLSRCAALTVLWALQPHFCWGLISILTHLLRCPCLLQAQCPEDSNYPMAARWNHLFSVLERQKSSLSSWRKQCVWSWIFALVSEKEKIWGNNYTAWPLRYAVSTTWFQRKPGVATFV